MLQIFLMYGLFFFGWDTAVWYSLVELLEYVFQNTPIWCGEKTELSSYNKDFIVQPLVA